MTIYPERNKQGQSTGVWIVEVRKMEKGVSKTLRRRTRDHSEAQRIETSLRGGSAPRSQYRLSPIVQPSPQRDSSGIHGFKDYSHILDTSWTSRFTLRKLFEGAQSIHIGAKDEKKSRARRYAALEILGWDTDILDVRTAALDYLVGVLRSRGISPQTCNRYLYAISGALRWALSSRADPRNADYPPAI